MCGGGSSGGGDGDSNIQGVAISSGVAGGGGGEMVSETAHVSSPAQERACTFLIWPFICLPQVFYRTVIFSRLTIDNNERMKVNAGLFDEAFFFLCGSVLLTFPAGGDVSGVSSTHV